MRWALYLKRSKRSGKDNVIILSTRILPMPIRISGDVCSISA